MKNQVNHKPTNLSRFFSELFRNFSALFVSSDKREFRRLKNFIAS